MSSTTAIASHTRISVTTPKGLTGQVHVRPARQHRSETTRAPVVFLHGATGLFDDEPFLDALSETRTVYAPVWPSFGEEEGEEALEDMLDFALHGADVVKALTQVTAHDASTGGPVIIGHDMGAMIAAEMACQAPSSISALVLLAPLGLWHAAYPIPDIFAMLPFEFPEMLFADHQLGTRLLTRGLDFEDPKAIERFQVRNARQLGMAGKIMFPIPNRRLSKRLYRCDTPTLIAWGANDKLTLTEPYSALWQNSLPQAKTVTIKSAGHMLHLEQPNQLAEIVTAFLQAQ